MQDKSDHWQMPLQAEFWSKAASHYERLVMVPFTNNQLNWSLWANFSAQHHLATNSVFLARYDQAKLDAANDAMKERLRTGQYDPKTLYILENDQIIPALLHLNPQKDLLAKIDGFYVLAPDWQTCSVCIKVPAVQQVNLAQLMSKVGEVIAFGRIEQPKYLLNVSHGWAFPEPWGIWSDGLSAQLILGIPEGAQSLTLTARAFVSPRHPTQEITLMVNGQQREDLILTKDSNNLITISITKEDRQAGHLVINLKFKNPVRPQDLGMGDDQRLLSIGLVSGVFR